MSSQNQGSSSSQGSADYLRSATFSTGSGAINGDNNAVTASELLAGGFDPARLHPMAGLKDQLEYLQLDDDKVNDLPGATTALPSRGWSDDLCYGTGTTYLSGMSSFFPLLLICLALFISAAQTIVLLFSIANVLTLPLQVSLLAVCGGFERVRSVRLLYQMRACGSMPSSTP